MDDYQIQSMPDVSPPKWHLAHTTWFFEHFLLARFAKHYEAFHPKFNYLFNSYYETVGSHHERVRRGLLSRPTVEEVYRYRAYVNEKVLELLDSAEKSEICPILTLGLHHEQQHQELILMDIKHIYWSNPLRPAYRKKKFLEPEPDPSRLRVPAAEWVPFSGGLKTIGADPASGRFTYDNECPPHRVYLEDFQLQSRLVTNGDFLEFIEAGGYRRPEFWLSDGWAKVSQNAWEAPLYWEKVGSEWWMMSLSGMKPVNPLEPVCHVSFYEADAFAKWKGHRLPTEHEWEVATEGINPKFGNFCETGQFQPVPISAGVAIGESPGSSPENSPENPTSPPADRPAQLFGDVWEWCASPYQPYPGFKPFEGSIGEYNGKFMCNQMVLRGGSFGTPVSHIRATYRNFFPPDARWAFSGFRLARE